MYRQLTLPQLRAMQGSGQSPPQRGSRAQGTADVDDAWDHYLRTYNKGRGVVLIGHSQGAGQISRLVRAKNIGGQLDRGQRDAPLDPAMHLEQLEMHVDCFGQLRMGQLDCAQLRRLA